MLLSLSVKNLALIDSVQMDFCAGFNVLTGETGAGKSIIVDSLKLALGAKNERELLGRGKKRASVEAVFGVKDNARVHAFLAQQQLPDEEDTLGLSREINESGRSVCRINGVLVASSIVKQLSAYLIDIYGQHDHQSLLNSASHLQFLDASDETGKIAEMTAELGGRYRKIAAMRARLRENLIDPRERERQLDILRFQRDEIDRMNLKEGEEEELTRQRDKLVAGETIKIFNYGNCKRDFTYIDDIVEGVVRVMRHAPERSKGEDGLPVPPYKVYNIGNNNPENLLDFVSILQEELVRAGVLPADYDFEAHKELVPMQPGDVPITYADTTPLEEEFGFNPSTPLREGLRRFARWYGEYRKGSGE